MDKTDRQILQHFNENAAQPVVDVARKVNLSVTPCWRRMQWLEKFGNMPPATLFDAENLVLALALLKCADQQCRLAGPFAMVDMPEVVEITG